MIRTCIARGRALGLGASTTRAARRRMGDAVETIYRPAQGGRAHWQLVGPVGDAPDFWRRPIREKNCADCGSSLAGRHHKAEVCASCRRRRQARAALKYYRRMTRR
jgi:hypothetical protein